MSCLHLRVQRMTPLMVAATNGDAEIARLLVKRNADFQERGPKASLKMHLFIILS